jgi:hypothetical protein
LPGNPTRNYADHQENDETHERHVARGPAMTTAAISGSSTVRNVGR